MKTKLLMFLFFLSSNVSAFSIVGTWQLVSIDQYINNQWKPDCIAPTGMIIYTSNGHMSAGINCMRSDKFNSPLFTEHDVTFYNGTYTIKDNTVIHHVKNASSAVYYGKTLQRKIQIINNNEMNLTVKNKNGLEIRLKWKRII